MSKQYNPREKRKRAKRRLKRKKKAMKEGLKKRGRGKKITAT